MGQKKVFPNGTVKEETFLRDVTDGSAQAGLGDIANGMAVEKDVPAARFRQLIEPAQQVDDG